MITIRIIREGRQGYYLRTEDSNQTDLPTLCGSGAELLGVASSSVEWDDERLSLLLNGIHPQTLHQLRRRAPGQRQSVHPKTGKTKLYKPVVGYDMVANAPKDVSILGLALAQPKAIELHSKAVQQVINSLGQYCTARTKAGLVNLKPVVLVQTHLANRNLECHLHSHCLIVNTGLITSHQGRAIEGRRLLQSCFDLGQLYRSMLRSLVESELEVSTFSIPLRKGESFGIHGIPESLRELFSRRSKSIRAYVEQTEKITGKTPKGSAIRDVAVRERAVKQHMIDREHLIAEWQRQVREHTLSIEPPCL